jgi:hypothetical protein
VVPPQTVVERVIHVWVDPAYGDDAKASGSQGPPGNPSSQVNCYYGTTRVDIHPHLLPDVHPWWYSSATGPSNPEWRHCITGYNPLLYWDPTFPRINPPGTHWQPGTNNQYVWLDQATYLSQAVNIVSFGRFDSSAPGALANFDAWCLGYQGGSIHYDILPPTAGEMTPVDPTKAVGVSLETLQATWSKTQLSNKNVQAFRILVRTRQ